MNTSPTHLQPRVAQTLEQWHQMVARKDFSELHTIVHPDAVFRSPMANAPYGPAPALILALSTVIQVFEGFEYHRQLSTDDGLSFQVFNRPDRISLSGVAAGKQGNLILVGQGGVRVTSPTGAETTQQ